MKTTIDQLKTLTTLVQAGLSVTHMEVHPYSGVLTATHKTEWENHVLINPDGTIAHNRFVQAMTTKPAFTLPVV